MFAEFCKLIFKTSFDAIKNTLQNNCHLNIFRQQIELWTKLKDNNEYRNSKLQVNSRADLQ